MSPSPAVILAGGKGTRLAPYTSILPKPLMPIGHRAILEIVVEQLAACEFRKITLCVGHLAHLIQAVFNSGADRNVEIDYVYEQESMGTAGPLRLVDGLTDTFLAMNGDILTTLDYLDLLAYHRENENVMTVAVHERTTKIDYGVLYLEEQEAKGSRVTVWEEKPEIPMTVSMGVYVLEPAALEYIPRGCSFDVPDLIQALLADGQPVGGYRFGGYWMDIGRQEDYAQAAAAWEKNSERFLRPARAARSR
jgi:NDP-sugar pyrophosphorylase family protein